MNLLLHSPPAYAGGSLHLIPLAHPQALALSLVFPVLGVIGYLAARRRLHALARLGSGPALQALATVSRWQRALRSLCFTLALMVLIFATAGPQWGYQPQPLTATGRDLVVVLDLSRSMQAEDVLPNRLGRAKQALDTLVETIQYRGGHRLGLVVFAGNARVLCPLTPDYDHFREALANLDPTDPALAPIPAELGPTSGTRMGLALRQAVEIQDTRFSGHQDILLISDGDDPVHDDEWQIGVAAASERGIPIYTVGIGNPDESSIIPDADGKPLFHNDREIRTRLDERPLAEMARLTGGVYLPARLDPPPLADWFRSEMNRQPGHATLEDIRPMLRPRYAWFFAAALLLFALATIIPDRRPGIRRRKPVKTQKLRDRLSPVPLLLGTLVLISAAPRTAEDLVRAGNRAFHQQAYERALDYYSRAEETTREPGLVAFNKAAAFYHLGQYHQAELHYLRSLEDARDERRANIYYDLANAILKQAEANQDVKQFDRAIGYYRDCLAHDKTSDALREDARYNLQLAQALRRQVKPRDEQPKPNNSKPDDPKSKLEDKKPGQTASGNEASDKDDSHGKMQRIGEKGLEKQAGVSKRRTPGQGNMQPVPDEEETVPLPPEEAAEHLRQAAERILSEHKQHRKAMPPPSKNVLNW